MSASKQTVQGTWKSKQLQVSVY